MVNAAGKKIAVIHVRAFGFCQRMPLFCEIEKANPSEVHPSLSIRIDCASPKQEERLLHHIAAEVGGKLVMTENENAEDGSSALTHKENIVFELLLQGLECRAISEKLFISIETVRVHKKNIYRKLNVHSRGELLKKFQHRADENTLPY